MMLSRMLLLYMSLCLFYSSLILFIIFFFFNDTATTEIYTLSLHDALPILGVDPVRVEFFRFPTDRGWTRDFGPLRSEEHTSELQSHVNLVCRLLLEKKN